VTKKLAKRKKGTYFDYPMLFVVLFLVGFGLVMIYSTSSYTSSVQHNGSTTYWLVRQAVFGAGGLVAMTGIIFFDYRLLKNKICAYGIYGIAVTVQLIVLLLGVTTKGSKRWLSIAGFQFQPSEFSKICLIIFLAYGLSRSSHKLGKYTEIFKWVLLAAPIIVLVVVENLSTALVLCAITGILIFVLSPKTYQLMAAALLAFLAGVIYIFYGPGYRMERIEIWKSPETHEKGLQTIQALYGIGSGGIFGKGLGNSMQKMGFLPESHNDMIFSIICEELGLFGAIAIICVFMVLIWRILIIAVNAPDLFGSLIAIGVAVHVGIQTMLNIGVVTNFFPPTGIPLPFISYGGSSLIVLLIEMGFVLSISRQIKV
jgi:cell division protein FtsW